ncbi:16118_t:CDS:2 [Funneliformis geosporum]|uniref:18184_t:CDS:1 n=1 Tax=Funneliformis geosporum TaxID=1117311 RepID=A0A9W4WNN6_9GLOM|nr:16118_t:CDS:2 [Funneliformis geosporum]CAI2167332.1 18184_t:CDS:2 [Funneliformis geosporum]
MVKKLREDCKTQRTQIQVTTTDGDPSTWPETDLRIRSGYYAFFYYEVVEDSPIYRQWMETLGDAISNKKENKDESFILQGFPSGYKLFFHAKYPASSQINRVSLPMTAVHNTAENNGLIERTDIYLFGLPSGRRFRSKNEFIPHLKWLHSGKSGICECKYCNRSTRKNNQFTQKLCIKSTTTKHVSKYSSKDFKVIKEVKNKEKDKEKDKILRADLDRATLSILFGPVYRPKEIVWVVGPNQTLVSHNPDESPSGRNIEEFYNWPGYVMSVHERGERSSDFKLIRETIYEIQILALDRIKYYPESSLIPWIARNANAAMTSPGADPLIDVLFSESINIGVACQRSYLMQNEYKFKVSNEVIASTEDKVQKKRLRNAKKCPHYDEMIFGNEIIRSNDLIRLTVENEDDEESRSLSSSLSSNKFREMELFRICTMYRLANDRIQFTGDLYFRKDENENIKDLGMSEDDERLQGILSIGKYKYVPRNFPQEEYTVDIEDLAGRFYIDWEELTGVMTPTDEKHSKFLEGYLNDINDRMQIQGETMPTLHFENHEATPIFQFENHEATPMLQLENHDSFDDESDSQMSDVECLNEDSFFDFSAMDDENDTDDVELDLKMMHQNSLQRPFGLVIDDIDAMVDETVINNVELDLTTIHQNSLPGDDVELDHAMLHQNSLVRSFSTVSLDLNENEMENGTDIDNIELELTMMHQNPLRSFGIYEHDQHEAIFPELQPKQSKVE